MSSIIIWTCVVSPKGHILNICRGCINLMSLWLPSYILHACTCNTFENIAPSKRMNHPCQPCISSLTASDVQIFFNLVYKQGSKCTQDKFLIKYITVNELKHNRKRKADSVRNKPVKIKYSVFKKGCSPFQSVQKLSNQ